MLIYYLRQFPKFDPSGNAFGISRTVRDQGGWRACFRRIADRTSARLSPTCVEQDLANVIALIERAKERATPVLVGIDGRSGTGKSTFAVALATATRALLIEGDAFYAGGAALRRDTAQQRADACIDRPKLRLTLRELKAGRATSYRAFDWDAFDGSLSNPAVLVQPREVIIVEGVYGCHPDLMDILDIKVLLRIPDALREQRLVTREGSIGPWERQWHEAEDWYFSHLAVDATFDPILN